MFTLDPNQSHVMPAHFGPRYIGEKTSGRYHDCTAMTVSYLTDREKLAAYLPAPFEVAEEAVVTVYYVCNKQVDWLAGHGYNMIAVNAAVVYNGEQEQLSGTYCLVIWENLTDPILVGREVQGIPKIYADIPEHSIHGGNWSCNASHFGHKIIDIAISNLEPLSAEDVAAGQQAQEGKDHPMTWRYMPAIGGFGEAAVNEPVTFPSENNFTDVWTGEGCVDWARLTWEQNPTQYHIVNALQALPVLAYLPALVTKGSTNLVLPERWTRTLR
ncbi:acetoacetate decarboxylase family protein [Candidatus Litorirhabdus singularis]|nr:acetoacetate decarboxylase family protein [Candidatus Litorirhabdus singularis]